MNDLRILLEIFRRHKDKVLALVLIVAVSVFLNGGAQRYYVSISPDDAYRLEHFIARRYQRLLNWNMEYPSFVRLYRNTDDRYFGESPVADFFGGNGQPLWIIDQAGVVAVGLDIRFTGIPPVTASGDELPIPKDPGAVLGEQQELPQQ